MKWIMILILLAVAVFCLFGFMATFEPGANSAMLFRIVYAVVGLGCLFRAGRTIFQGGRAS
ncbi:MAG: hypothetical protein ACON5N_18545 [Akkermansiaceae bacterium]